MKELKFIPVAISILLATNATAQNENWDTYMAKFGSKPGSVLVDLALYETAPNKLYPNLVITGPQAHNCNAQGFPDKDEIDQLEEILDATGNFLTGLTPKVLAGTFTSNCQRMNYYYVKDTAGVRNAIARLYNRSYRDYKYAISIKHDPEWKTYRTFLYPGPETRNWMENDKIITKMMQQGDSLKKPRNINFDLYFRSDTERNAVVVYAKNKGYKTDTNITSKSAAAPYEAVISKYSPVKMDTINAMSQELQLEARKHHGLYNGWEAPQK